MGKTFSIDLLLKMCVVHICDGGGNASKYNLGYFSERQCSITKAPTTRGLIKHSGCLKPEAESQNPRGVL